MKWSLQQLYKFKGEPFLIEGEFDFKDAIENIDDIFGISLVKVTGYGKQIYDNRYEFHLSIVGNMILEDAVTLDPVQYDFDIKVIEVFDTLESSDDVRIIEKNTIELDEVVWENILLEKPIRFVKDEQ